MLLDRLKNDNKAELKLNELQRKVKAQITQKLVGGTYKLENIKCTVCNSSDKETIGEKDRYGLSYKTNLCTQCGLVYTNPRMDQSSYNEFYNTEYRQLYVGKETASVNFFNAQRSKGHKIYSYLEEHNLIKNKSSFVLEVGCGAGGIVDVFKKKGHTVKGIDLGEEYVNYGIKNYGLDLEVGFLSDLNLEEKPSIIIYSHVMEHILDLNKELQTIKEYIDKDTIVYIEVPGIKEIHKNFESNILRYFQNAHTFHFSLESLTNLFAENGFELIGGNQYVQSAFGLSDKKTPIKSDFDNVKAYMQSTEKNRWKYRFTANGIKLNATRLILKMLDFTKLRPVIKKIRNALSKKS